MDDLALIRTVSEPTLLPTARSSHGVLSAFGVPRQGEGGEPAPRLQSVESSCSSGSTAQALA
jgi:hypothetical protein